MELHWIEIIALIIAGLMVGFINTLAGGGSIISLSVLMVLGLPANIANGTNRIAIAVQTLTASTSFRQQKVLDTRKGIILGIPALIGSIVGALIAVDINESVFEKAIAVIMLIMLVFIIYKPQKWLTGKEELLKKKTNLFQIILFFLIGIYGGFIHMGVGYFLLIALVFNIGYDLVKANAVKVFIVLIYTPAALLIFLIYGQVNWEYGLTLTIGNVVGALVASRLAVKKGANFVRWVIVVVILLTSGHLFGLYNIKSMAEKAILGSTPAPKTEWVIVVHGGAGAGSPASISPEKQTAYTEAISHALDLGSEILAKGGSSLDAIEAAIRSMEDNPVFNAGKGAVFTAAGINELDASIMDGRDRNAGAVSSVTNIKNPISAARLVMEQSPHVMLIAEGAEEFAAMHGIEIVDPSYFYTSSRWESLQRIKNREEEENRKLGTVGAVALDKAGNLAAGTSTGGMTNKMHGRVGDSPIIGAGTFADNQNCAVSATGHGEYFIRNVISYDIAAMMTYAALSVEEAADSAIFGKLKPLGAEGGIIAVDKDGNMAMPFNTSSMIRGFRSSTGEWAVAIF
ncbi:MAG: TSUP family transporter [Bacteroidales bacterium]|nr:TSUP family transporter [Bacteroidales bacterium]